MHNLNDSVIQIISQYWNITIIVMCLFLIKT